MKLYRGKLIPENYEELCETWEKYYNENEKYPNSTTCNIDTSLPSWNSVKYVCGDRFEEFKGKYKNEPNRKKYKVELYYDYCQKIIEISKKINKTPTIYELKKYDDTIPDYRWFIANVPNSSVKDYNDLMTHIGLKPNYFVSKEMATELILKKLKESNGVLKKEDFENPSNDEVGIGTIKRIWGSLNNMFLDLNIPINQLGTYQLIKTVEELEQDIIKLCEYLYEKNGHKHVSLNDIYECEWCSSHGTYNKKFNEEFNMSIGEYIRYIGYIPNTSGMGMVYEFDDGEVTTSKYEYKFSNLLRNNEIKYIRNVKYKDFVNDYDGNKDCDYVIEYDNTKYYIEIAGMLRDSKSIEHTRTSKLHYIQQKYFNDLLEKEEMLKKSKLNYYIIFPYQFNDMDFLMSLINQSKSS